MALGRTFELTGSRVCLLAVAMAVLAVSCGGGGDGEALEQADVFFPATATADPANWQTESDELFGRYLMYTAALEEAYGLPAADPDRVDFDALAGSEAAEDVRADIGSFRDTGRVLVVEPDSADEHVVWMPSEVPVDKSEGNEVEIQDCWILDQSVQTLEGEVMNSFFTPALYDVTMKVVDGEWKVWAWASATADSAGWDWCFEVFDGIEG